MSPAWIRRRDRPPSARSPKGTRSYQVLYRRGGRGWPIETAGTFKTEREARLRRDLIAGWLAQALDPKTELAKHAAATSTKTYRQVAAEYKTSRIDHTPASARNVESHLRRLNAIYGDQDPAAITIADCVAGVAELAKDLKPSSLSRYWTTHKLVLDFAGVRPNPARDRLVKLPTIHREEAAPPPSDHVVVILDLVPAKWRLPLVVIEQTAMAGGEIAQLQWGDVDTESSRFRLRRATVKGRIRARARWVQVPEWLMAIVDGSCPPDDRVAGRRVFPGFAPDSVRTAMSRACRAAGIPVYSPHDLRHRRISLWHGQGVPARELAARAGHTRASMSLDVYSHVMPLEEVAPAALERLLVMTR